MSKDMNQFDQIERIFVVVPFLPIPKIQLRLRANGTKLVFASICFFLIMSINDHLKYEFKM